MQVPYHEATSQALQRISWSIFLPFHCFSLGIIILCLDYIFRSPDHHSKLFSTSYKNYLFLKSNYIPLLYWAFFNSSLLSSGSSQIRQHSIQSCLCSGLWPHYLNLVLLPGSTGLLSNSKPPSSSHTLLFLPSAPLFILALLPDMLWQPSCQSELGILLLCSHDIWYIPIAAL